MQRRNGVFVLKKESIVKGMYADNEVNRSQFKGARFPRLKAGFHILI